MDRTTNRRVTTRLATNRVLLSMMIVGQKRQAAFQDILEIVGDKSFADGLFRFQGQMVTEQLGVPRYITQQLFLE